MLLVLVRYSFLGAVFLKKESETVVNCLCTSTLNYNYNYRVTQLSIYYTSKNTTM
jgi:hypothetical protein